MSHASIEAIALTVGGVLGGIFFGGLWLTVRNALTAPNPGLRLLVSQLLRMGIVLTGFYYVSVNGWQSVLLCLVGFLIARTVVTRITRPRFEVRHAPQL
jgi:F1F0 ATPase subunit 2